jgi:hypothetical protein
MEAVREKWTDERLDDLNRKVDDGFAEMRAEFRELRAEIRFQTRLFIAMYGVLIAALVALHK